MTDQMSPFHTGYNPDNGVTCSILRSWVDCRERARLYLDGIRPKIAKASLWEGSLFHDILMHLYRSMNLSKLNDIYYQMEKRIIEESSGEDQLLSGLEKMETAKDVINAYIKYYRKTDFPSKRSRARARSRIAPSGSNSRSSSRSSSSSNHFYTFLNLEKQFDIYWNVKGEVSSNIETDSMFEETSIYHRLRGKIDAILKDSDGHYWIMETKTKSRMGHDYINTLSFDFQALFYSLAVEDLIGSPVKGVIFNLIRRPSSKNYQEDLINRPDHYFQRIKVQFPKGAVEKFKKELHIKIKEFTQWAYDPKNLTWKNEYACTGKWTCQYLDICATGSDPKTNPLFHNEGKFFSELSV